MTRIRGVVYRDGRAGRKLTAASRARLIARNAALFDSYIERVPFCECWLWTGSVNEDGYGTFGKVTAHRVAYARLGHVVPEGMELDHLCKVRYCVNPRHLEPVTHRVNVLRGESVAATYAARTHCPQGHPLVQARGKWRLCRECTRAAARRNYWNRKGR